MVLYHQHPGAELERKIHDYDMNISQFSRYINVSSSRISEIVSGKRSITVDTAQRLSKAFGNTPQFWMIKQMQYDISRSENKHNYVDDIVPLYAQQAA